MSSGNPTLNIENILSKFNANSNINPLSIYIHIPYCKRKCRYCDFNSYPEAPSSQYLNQLLSDIEYLGGLNERTIQSIYIGGGTPSIVDSAIIESIMGQFYKFHNLSSYIEVTIEVNPESVTKDSIKHYLQSGINRISLGVQSFSEKSLRALGRIGKVKDNLRALEIIGESGIKNLNIDLIFGIPGQEIKDWCSDLEQTIEFKPEHISAYMLTPPSSIIANNLPDEEKVARMFLYTIEFLESNGWNQYEISNYARNGLECRHNLNYWNWGEYLGIGAGAHSFIKNSNKNNGIAGIRFWTEKLPGKYEERGIAFIDGFEHLDKKTAVYEIIMLGLRTRQGVNLKKIEDFFPFDSEKLRKRVDSLIDNGFLFCENNTIKLTLKGLPVSNAIISSVLNAFLQ